MPFTDHHIGFHLLKHCIDQVQFMGPPYFYWMYIFERLNSKLKRYITSRSNPKASILASHVQSEASLYMREVHGEELLPSFACENGKSIWDQYGSSSQNQSPSTPGIQFPLVMRVSDRYAKVVPSVEQKEAFRALLRIHCSYRERDAVWRVCRPVSISGVVRTSTCFEPAFPREFRRRSGFVRCHDQHSGLLFAQITAIFKVGEVGVVEVSVFAAASVHAQSAMLLVRKDSTTTEYMLAEDVPRSVVMFVPCWWEQDHWCVIDTQH